MIQLRQTQNSVNERHQFEVNHPMETELFENAVASLTVQWAISFN